MPCYDLYCPKDDTEILDHYVEGRKFDSKKLPKCPKCGTKMEVNVYNTVRSMCVSGHGFTPYYNRGLGRMVSSAAEQDRIAKEIGVEHVGREGGA